MKNSFEEKPKSSLIKVLEILITMASKPSGFIGLTILIFHVVLAVTSPWFAPYDYKSITSFRILFIKVYPSITKYRIIYENLPN